jgi:hypothetical protein
MYYAIDDNLLSKLKQLAASDSNNAELVEALTAAEADPLIGSLMWTKADLLAASRKLIQGDNPKNRDGIWFNRNLPFADSAREELAREIACFPDELCLGIRDEVDSAIEQGVIEIVRPEPLANR